MHEQANAGVRITPPTQAQSTVFQEPNDIEARHIDSTWDGETLGRFVPLLRANDSQRRHDDILAAQAPVVLRQEQEQTPGMWLRSLPTYGTSP